MMLKKKSLKNCDLYLVLDASVAEYGRLLSVADQAIQAGVDIVQLRDKRASARELLKMGIELKKCIGGRVPFIINDRVDLALSLQADGVHLGQDDMAVNEARKILGSGYIIGTSCQNISHLQKAHKDGADYIGFGSVYATKTKPEREAMDLRVLEEAVKQARIPLFAIGGITKDNIKPLIYLGVRRVALTRSVLGADDVKKETEKLKEILSADKFCESSSVAEH